MNKVFGVFLFGVAGLGTTALGMERGQEDRGKPTGPAAAVPYPQKKTPDYKKIAMLLNKPEGEQGPMEGILKTLATEERKVLSFWDAFSRSVILNTLAQSIKKDSPLEIHRTIARFDYDIENVLPVGRDGPLQTSRIRENLDYYLDKINIKRNPAMLLKADEIWLSSLFLNSEIAIILTHDPENQKRRSEAFKECDRVCGEFKQYIEWNTRNSLLKIPPLILQEIQSRMYFAYQHLVSLSIGRHTVSRQERVNEILDDIMFTITNIQEALKNPAPEHLKQKFWSQLVHTYCHQAIAHHERTNINAFNESLRLAKETLQKLRKNKKEDEKRYTIAQTHIESCEAQAKILTVSANSGRGKIADARRARALTRPDVIKKLFDPSDEFEILETLHEKMDILKAFLNEDRGSKTGSAPEDSIKRILELEAWIAKDSGLHPTDLFGTYEYAMKQRWDVIPDLRDYALWFIKAGRFEEASQRADISVRLNTQKKEPEYSRGLYLGALAENLRGNFGPLLALQGKIDRKKKAKKERQRNKIVENAKEAIEAAQKEQAAAEAAQAEQSNRQEPKRLQRLQTASAGSPSDLVCFEPVLSPQKEKEARKARHQAAEERRANQVSAAAKSSSESEGGVALPTPLSSSRDPQEEREAVLQKVLSKDDTPISDLYSLKGVAAKVEREISEDTWKFNRKQFDTYLEALGCTQSRMRGSHKTISLPTIICITQGETVVMVLTQAEDDSLNFESTSDGSPAIQQAFGGSLTLPPWDSKHVPLYLQKQILSARKSLWASGLLARKNQPAAAKNLG